MSLLKASEILIKKEDCCKHCVSKESSASPPKRWECCIFGANENRLIQSPPYYLELGEQARDIFSKGYNFGLIKLGMGLQPSPATHFALEGQSDAGIVTGFLETRYEMKDYGLMVSEKFKTENQELQTKVCMKDKFMQGLKVKGICNFIPPTGEVSGTVSVGYQNSNLAASTDIDIDKEANTVLGASAVVGYQGWFVGCQGAYDIANNSFTKSSFAVGFATEDIILHTNANNKAEGIEYGGLVYKKCAPSLETGVSAAWTAGGEKTRLGIGARYYLENGNVLRCKINSASQIGLGYSQPLREGVTLNLSALVDAKNPEGHKIGLGLCFQA